jgi:hypothetical protein
MRMTLEPTEQFFMLGDVMVRAWQGQDDRGGALIALVAAIAVEQDSIPGLTSIPPPGPVEAEQWARTILDKARAEK